uniref:Leader peptide 1 n=1 Tax=Staphylococcus xylosus TaxID=1288 RepID=A0A077X5A2_STAXY|nr:leader peptide 1 [Staphylococcus xylosus]
MCSSIAVVDYNSFHS